MESAQKSRIARRLFDELAIGFGKLVRNWGHFPIFINQVVQIVTFEEECAPLVCVSDVMESLAVWRQNNPRTKGRGGTGREGTGREGTGRTSDVVKVKGEEPATQGYHLRSVDTRKSPDRNDSPISG